MKIVATTSLPAVDRPNVDRLNAARSRQYLYKTYIQVVAGRALFSADCSRLGIILENQATLSVLFCYAKKTCFCCY